MTIEDLAYTRLPLPLRSNSRSRTGLMYCIDCSINSGVSLTIVSELLIKLLLYNEALILFVTCLHKYTIHAEKRLKDVMVERGMRGVMACPLLGDS